MRPKRVAIIVCALCLCGRPPAMETAAAAGTLPLHECRLEHPQRMSSVAARCGALRVAEDPTQPSGGEH